MTDGIDLNYRPASYFRPQKLERYLLSKVEGAVLREKLNALFAEGRHADVRELLTSEALSARDRTALESIHPMFMGGNYLPDTDDSEVEIARISIDSTTADVICVYARAGEGAIHYRVVDEYGGDTLQGPAEARTAQPMTLGGFTDFFLQAWPLIEVLEMNFEGDLEGALGFFSASSELYPDLDRLCRQRAREHFSERKPEDESARGAGDRCPVCGHFNSPPAGDMCEHICARVWDGQIETFGHGKALESCFRELAELVGTAEEESIAALILGAEADRSQLRSELIEAASGNMDFAEVLKTLEKGDNAPGWSTNGMCGGSGCNLYVRRPGQLDALAAECRAILDACNVEIETERTAKTALDNRRPRGTVEWQLAASGFWDDDSYHSGHIAYYVASSGRGEWVMESVERNAVLDDVTEEDIEEGRLNDDQLQALWGTTLEDAQNAEYRQIVAACSGASPEADAAEIAAVLYQAVCDDGGKEIIEPDGSFGLLEL